MKKYIVFEESTCPCCNGQGVVYNGWFWDDFHAKLDPHDYAREVHGLDEAPPEEETCPNCNGAGVVRREVDLLEAIDDPAVSRAIARAIKQEGVVS